MQQINIQQIIRSISLVKLRALPIAMIIFPIFGLSAIAQSTFGRTGQDGTQGRNGRDGRDGQNIKIVSDGKPLSYDLSGTSGEDGEDGTSGRSAESCEQPYRPEYSLVGASGGRGGNGGAGGRGGNGGRATIFYTDISTLQQIEIRNTGSRGGRNGRGAISGKGCECQESEWQIKYCTWNIDRKPFKDDKAAWQSHSKETRLCKRSGGDYEYSSSRAAEYRKDDWIYRRTYKGVTQSDYYSCKSGRDGAVSKDGSNGLTGSYGRITLVPRLDIPEEISNHRAPLATAIGKKVGLIKNIWVEKSGLSRLLRPSSDVADGYTYLQDTARLFYRIDWAASESPTALGIDRVDIGATVNVRNAIAEIQYKIPNTLEYQIIPATNSPANSSENLQVVKITGGFEPSRLSSWEIQKISGIGNENQLILRDRGNIRELLKDTQIEVQCFSKQSATGIVSSDYQKRLSVTFKIPPKFAPNNGAIATGDTYTLPVGRYCSPWLKSDYNAAYGVVIEQTTKSGAKYEQNIDSAFVVGKD
jgi:hypothetical protein